MVNECNIHGCCSLDELSVSHFVPPSLTDAHRYLYLYFLRMKHTQESLTSTQKLLWSSLSHQSSSTNGFLPPGWKYSVTDLVNEADEPLESKQQDVYCRVNKAGDKMKIIVWPTFISPHIHFMRKRNHVCPVHVDTCGALCFTSGCRCLFTADRTGPPSLLLFTSADGGPNSPPGSSHCAVVL